MFIDLHMHEKTFSKDSFLALDDIIRIAKEKGLDGICITDHDSMGLKDYAEEYGRKIGFPIFVGVEYYSLDGDIVTFGIDAFPETRIPAQEYVDWVNAKGGVCISAHPYRNNNRGLRDKLETTKGLAAVEAFNGSTSEEDNLHALASAEKMGVQPIGASDCHVQEKVGVFATYVPFEVKTTTELVQALKQNKCRPAVYENGAYRVL